MFLHSTIRDISTLCYLMWAPRKQAQDLNTFVLNIIFTLDIDHTIQTSQNSNRIIIVCSDCHMADRGIYASKRK